MASTAVCVTGMHRSGTSFMASALRALGVSLGDPDRLMRPGPDNPAGYFEVQSILDLNQELLAHLGGSWDAPPVLEAGWEQAPDLATLHGRAVDVLGDTFGPENGRPPLIGFKDPRLSVLLPFWRRVTAIKTTLVLVRDQAEVAQSLGARRYAVAAPQSAALWLRYLYAAVTHDPGPLLIRYTDLFDDLPGTLCRVARHLGVAEPDAAALTAASAQLDPSLRHHRDAGDSVPPGPLMAVAQAVWNNGAVDLHALPDPVAHALATGWLGSALDADLLARARATVVALQETLRQRDRRLAALGVDVKGPATAAAPDNPAPR